MESRTKTTVLATTVLISAGIMAIWLFRKAKVGKTTKPNTASLFNSINEERKMGIHTPGLLLQRARFIADKATKSGHLIKLTCGSTKVRDAGGTFEFLISTIDHTVMKPNALKKKINTCNDKAVVVNNNNNNNNNPFDDALIQVSPLLVCSTPTHNIVLNKFPVSNDHLIATTRKFDAQTASLTRPDFAVMMEVLLSEIDGVCFFNCGADSGASQPHKHIQFVPRESFVDSSGNKCVVDAGGAAPADGVIIAALDKKQDGTTTTTATTTTTTGYTSYITIDEYTFKHAIADVRDKTVDEVLELYHGLMENMELPLDDGEINFMLQHSLIFKSYNLILTREYMLLVPRSLEEYEGVSVNSLGFIGCMLTKSLEQLDKIKQNGPLSFLEAVTYPIY